jgi:shikimate dehydrogenase
VNGPAPLLNAETRLVALIGQPVAHSLSPLMHNVAFAAHGLNWCYAALPVASGQVAEAVAGLGALSFAGANVTVPHKEAALPHVDRLTDRAEAIGALNTLFWDEGGALTGDNTDAAGFLAPLEEHAGALEGRHALIFGAGGAARAATYALLTSGFAPARLTLAARTPRRAERLADDLAPVGKNSALAVVPEAEAGEAVRSARLLVNATPQGMAPETGATPWPETADFRAGQVAYDLVYTPRETRFLREAAAQGATPVGGLEMLVGQAAASYRRWTGRDMPTAAVRQALREHLGR